MNVQGLCWVMVVAVVGCGGELAPIGDGGAIGEGGVTKSSDAPFFICPSQPPNAGTACSSPGDGCRYSGGSGCYLAIACIADPNGTATWTTVACN